MKYLGIRFPFTCKDSEGFLFDLTTTESDEIKSVIKLILTIANKKTESYFQ